MMNGKFYNYELDQRGVATVTLNRPDIHNAFNDEFINELTECFEGIGKNSDVRLVVLTGNGKSFCAGADLTEFLTAPSPIIARDVRRERDVWELFIGINKPFIAALHGYVLGSGLEIALCCDLRIASEDVQLGLPEVGLGIIPAAGGTQTLIRSMFLGRALEMLLTGRLISAKDAERFGLINQVVPKKDLQSICDNLASRIKSMNKTALFFTKRAVNAGLDVTLENGLEIESRLSYIAYRAA